MNNGFKSLLWKEVRETFPIGVSIFIVGGGIFGPWTGDNSNPAFPLAGYLGILAIYVMVMTATALTREAEDDRYVILRRFPISCRALVLSKALWIVASAALLAALFTGACLLHYATGRGDVSGMTRENLLFFLFSMLQIFLWGFFWTARVKSSWTSIALTVLSVSATCGILSAALDVETIYVPLLLLVVLAILTRRGVRRWFDSVDRRTSGPIRDFRLLPAFCRKYNERSHVRYSFFALTHQTLRRSAGLIGWVVLTLGLYSYYVEFQRNSSNSDPYAVGITLFFICAFVAFLSGIFVPDFKNDGAAVMVRLGISPAAYWLSRVFVSGLISLFVLFLLFCSEYYTHGRRLLSDEDMWDATLSFLALLYLVASGLFVGSIAKTRITAIGGLLAMGVFYNIFSGWILLFENKMILLGMVMTAILLSAVSYYGIRDRFFGRDTFGRRLRLTLGATLAILGISFFLLPLLSLWSIPVPEKNDVTESLRSDEADPARIFRAERMNALDHLMQTTFESETPVFVGGTPETPFFGLTSRPDSTVLKWAELWCGSVVFGQISPMCWTQEDKIYRAIKNGDDFSRLSSEDLREWIELLRLIPKTRLTFQTQLILNGNRIIKERRKREEGRLRSPFLRWRFERSMTLLVLRECAVGEYYERCFYRDEVPFSLKEFCQTRDSIPMPKISYVDNEFSDLRYIHFFGWIDYNIIRDVENARRARLLAAAYSLYRKEKGDWPDAPERVVEAGYLSELPTVSGTGSVSPVPIRAARWEESKNQWVLDDVPAVEYRKNLDGAVDEKISQLLDYSSQFSKHAFSADINSLPVDRERVSENVDRICSPYPFFYLWSGPVSPDVDFWEKIFLLETRQSDEETKPKNDPWELLRALAGEGEDNTERKTP